MKAKKVYENLGDVLKPKTEEEILASLADVNIRKYVDAKENHFSPFKDKPHEYDPLLVKVYYELKEKGYPVTNLHGETMAAGMGMSVDGIEFNLTVKDKDDTPHYLSVYQKNKTFITGRGDVKMDWMKVMDSHGKGIGHVGGNIYTTEELIKVIKDAENYVPYSYKSRYMKESIGDVLKPKSKEEMKKNSWDWVSGDLFEDKIPRVTKDGHEVFLVSQFSGPEKNEFKDYLKRKNVQHNMQLMGVSGLIFVQEVEEGYESYWEWKMGEWNIDGSLRISYDWTTPGMTIDPVTPEELEKLPDYEKN